MLLLRITYVYCIYVVLLLYLGLKLLTQNVNKLDLIEFLLSLLLLYGSSRTIID